MTVIHQYGSSSLVRLFVEVDGQRHRVSQVGDESLLLKEQVELRLGPATVIVSVDDVEREYDVSIKRLEGKYVSFSDDACGLPF